MFKYSIQYDSITFNFKTYQGQSANNTIIFKVAYNNLTFKVNKISSFKVTITFKVRHHLSTYYQSYG